MKRGGEERCPPRWFYNAICGSPIVCERFTSLGRSGCERSEFPDILSDHRRNFDVIRFATTTPRHQGTKIKTHIIPSRLRAFVAILFFFLSPSKFDVPSYKKITCPDEVRGRVPTGVYFHGSRASRGRQEGLQ
jgi:hypothetical protein